MDYRSRTRAVRAEARAKLLEIRLERLSRRRSLADAGKTDDQDPAAPAARKISKEATANDIGRRPVSEGIPVIETPEVKGSPELRAALGDTASSEKQEKSENAQKKTVKAKAGNAKAGKAKAVKAKTSRKKAKPAVVASKTDAEITSHDATLSEIAVFEESASEKTGTEQPDQISTEAAGLEAEPEIADVTLAADEAEIFREAIRSSGETNNNDTIGMLPGSLSETPAGANDSISLKLAPVSSKGESFSLGRLPSAGPGIIWHLNKCGIFSLDDLAHSNASDLARTMGPISRMVRLSDWIELARSVSGTVENGKAVRYA